MRHPNKTFLRPFRLCGRIIELILLDRQIFQLRVIAIHCRLFITHCFKLEFSFLQKCISLWCLNWINDYSAAVCQQTATQRAGDVGTWMCVQHNAERDNGQCYRYSFERSKYKMSEWMCIGVYIGQNNK